MINNNNTNNNANNFIFLIPKTITSLSYENIRKNTNVLYKYN